MNWEVLELKALTDIWTGGVNGRGSDLHLTGIRGSIRWWFEALVRAYEGYACDPQDEDRRCKLEYKKFQNELKKHNGNLQKVLDELICPACQLFGCTGWSAKFVLRVTDINGKEILNRIRKGESFRLIFIPQKPFTEVERALLKKTIKIIVECGAIGGKTVLKPSETPWKNIKRPYHQDYGLIDYQDESKKIEKINTKIILKRLHDNKENWPNLKYFWFIKGYYINRIQFNEITKAFSSDLNSFLKGGQGESKKIFSFHGQNSSNPDRAKRCFGYVRKKEELNEMIEKLKNICGINNILTWENIQNEL